MRDNLAIELRRRRINRAVLLVQSGHVRKMRRGRRIIREEHQRDLRRAGLSSMSAALQGATRGMAAFAMKITNILEQCGGRQS